MQMMTKGAASANVREVWEEAGLRDLVFRWGKGFQETPPYGVGKIARYYLASTQTSDVELPVNPLIGRDSNSMRYLKYFRATEKLREQEAAKV